MTTLHDADAVMAGAVPAVAVYAGTVKVWPSYPPRPATMAVGWGSTLADGPLDTPPPPQSVANGMTGTTYVYYKADADSKWYPWVWPITSLVIYDGRLPPVTVTDAVGPKIEYTFTVPGLNSFEVVIEGSNEQEMDSCSVTVA